MNLTFSISADDDVPAIVGILNKAAEHLTMIYGKGHWSNQCTEAGIRHTMKGNAKMLIAKTDNTIIGTLTLVTKKPWAIDITYFTKVLQPIYLIGMAVDPAWQRKGIGRYMLTEAIPFAIAWPAQSIRLDAYDNVAGAGEFYRKCGYGEKGRVTYKNNPFIYF